MVGEDFAFCLERAPGAMFRPGVANPARGLVHPSHHAEFVLDEEAIPVGAAVLVEAARRFLGGATDGPAQ